MGEGCGARANWGWAGPNPHVWEGSPDKTGGNHWVRPWWEKGERGVVTQLQDLESYTMDLHHEDLNHTWSRP